MQPPPQRRERLPTPKQHEKSVSLWSILKECVGKDLSRICLPVFFNEPLSVLQKTVEDLEYADLINKVMLPSFTSLTFCAYACSLKLPHCSRVGADNKGALMLACISLSRLLLREY